MDNAEYLDAMEIADMQASEAQKRLERRLQIAIDALQRIASTPHMLNLASCPEERIAREALAALGEELPDRVSIKH